MDKNKEEISIENSFEEAPASVNTRLKSKNGFVYQWTMRDGKNSNLFFKIKTMEEKWLEAGFTPVENISPFKQNRPKIEREYIEGRFCPLDGGRLVKPQPESKQPIKCENNKWNNTTKQAYGCKHIEWPNANNDTPERQIDES